jgi:hypothetical protein
MTPYLHRCDRSSVLLRARYKYSRPPNIGPTTLFMNDNEGEEFAFCDEEEEGGLYCRSATTPHNNTTRGRVGLGTMLLSWVFFYLNGALKFVLFCGRLAVSQYNFLFFHSTRLRTKRKKKHSSRAKLCR